MIKGSQMLSKLMGITYRHNPGLDKSPAFSLSSRIIGTDSLKLVKAALSSIKEKSSEIICRALTGLNFIVYRSYFRRDKRTAIIKDFTTFFARLRSQNCQLTFCKCPLDLKMLTARAQRLREPG